MKKAIIVSGIASLLLCNVRFAGFWTITQLTDNGLNDWYPDISGLNVAWMGWS